MMGKTKQLPLLLLVSILGFCNLSMTWDRGDDILTDEDMEMAELQDQPALSAAIGQEPYWLVIFLKRFYVGFLHNVYAPFCARDVS